MGRTLENGAVGVDCIAPTPVVSGKSQHVASFAFGLASDDEGFALDFLPDSVDLDVADKRDLLADFQGLVGFKSESVGRIVEQRTDDDAVAVLEGEAVAMRRGLAWGAAPAERRIVGCSLIDCLVHGSPLVVCSQSISLLVLSRLFGRLCGVDFLLYNKRLTQSAASPNSPSDSILRVTLVPLWY